MGEVKGVGVTGVDDFKADVSGLSTFDPTADEVDIGEVKGGAITSVEDFKADVSSLALETTAQAISTSILRNLGLSQENQYIDQTVFDNDKMTSARLRIYSDVGSVGTDNNVLAAYELTATFSGDNLETYKMVKL